MGQLKSRGNSDQRPLPSESSAPVSVDIGAIFVAKPTPCRLHPFNSQYEGITKPLRPLPAPRYWRWFALPHCYLWKPYRWRQGKRSLKIEAEKERTGDTMSIWFENHFQKIRHFQPCHLCHLDINGRRNDRFAWPVWPGKHACCVLLLDRRRRTPGRISNLATDTAPKLHCVIVASVFVFQKLRTFSSYDGCDNRGCLGWKSLPRKGTPKRFWNTKGVSWFIGHGAGLLTFANRFPFRSFWLVKNAYCLGKSFGNTTRSTVTRWTFWRLRRKKSAKNYVAVTRITRRVRVTSVFVNPRSRRGAGLSDRVVVMSNGHIEQIDQPGRLYAVTENSPLLVFDFLWQ